VGEEIKKIVDEIVKKIEGEEPSSVPKNIETN